MTRQDEWFDYLRRAGRGERTIASYRATFKLVDGDPLDMSVDDFEAWWAKVCDEPVGEEGEPREPKTLQRILNTMRSYYSWGVSFDYIDKSPARRTPAIKQGRRLPRPMSRSDMRKAMDNAPEDLRRAIALGAFAGMRVEEVAALDWKDVDLEGMRIWVRGKGDSDRTVGLGPLLFDEIGPPMESGSVVTRSAKSYSTDALTRRVNRYLKSLDIKGTFHKLRSRYATVAIAETGNLLAVSRALGHASPATTALYALTSDEDADRIAAAAER